jgi:hypothetical protein
VREGGDRAAQVRSHPGQLLDGGLLLRLAVDSAAVEEPVMFPAICVVPPAASWTESDISFVVAVCPSTAEAMVVCRPVICATIEEISSIAAAAAVVSPWIASTRRAMSSVAFAVSCASSLTSLAATAKPLPAASARAANAERGGTPSPVCRPDPGCQLVSR